MISTKLKVESLPLVFFMSSGSMVAVISGTDSSFDTLNYHLYNGWALTNRNEDHFLPTSIWTFFPSHLDFLYYNLWAHLPSAFVGAIFGALQGLLGYFVYQIVRRSETTEQFSSLYGLFFGFLSISLPLVRSQYGNSMHDLTLAVAEIYVVYKLLWFRNNQVLEMPYRVPILLGVLLALKPAHLVAFLAIFIYMLLSLKRNVRSMFRVSGICLVSFLITILPWFAYSFKETSSFFFPYLPNLGSKQFLSDGFEFTSYSEWRIQNLVDFAIHLVYPGGNASINNEIPYLDFTVPIILISTIGLCVMQINSRYRKEGTVAHNSGWNLIILGFTIYMGNQLVFTGVRYALVAVPIALSGFALLSREIFIHNVCVGFVVGLAILSLNFLPPQAIYLPRQPDPLTLGEVPDFGRTNNSYRSPLRTPFMIDNPTSRKDLVLLGQEQVSFVAPLWNSPASFVGLQAYILSQDSLLEIRNRIERVKARGGKVYLVALTYNLDTERRQLASVATNYIFSNCLPVKNPFNRDISLCQVELSQ